MNAPRPNTSRQSHAARRVSRWLFAPILALSLLLAGCASVDRGQQQAAQELQQQVLQVSQAAAEGDHASALLNLQELVALANEALARHNITEDTHVSILSAIDLVQHDLELAIEAERQALAEQAAQEALEEQQAQQPPADDNKGDDKGEGDDDDGPGNGNGNDKGNGKGKGNDG